MRILTVLLLSILTALQAQVPAPKLWWASGDSLYPVHNNIWVKGDSLEFDYAKFDSLVVLIMSADTFTVERIKLGTDLLGPTAFGVLDSLDVEHVSGATTIDPGGTLTITGEDVVIDEPGAGVASPYLYWAGDHGGVTEEAAIRLVQGVDPYMEILVDDDNTGPVLTSVLKIYDTMLLFSADNTTDIGATGATRPKDLYLAGSIQEVVNGIFSGRIDVDSIESRAGNFTGNVRIADTTFCDYYMGLSPMYFLSSSYFSYLSADTIEAIITTAPTFSMTDLENTEGYWDIIAGPDSLEWSITNNIYATQTYLLDLLIDEDDTMFVFFQETVNKSDYRLLRNSGGGWSSVGTIGDELTAISTHQLAMCLGAGDSIFMVFGNGTSLCASVWDGANFSAIDTIQTGCTYPGSNSDIARESDGTLHVVGNFDTDAGLVGYWTGTLGSWSSVDTVVTAGAPGTGGSIVLTGSDPHIFLSTTTATTNRWLYEYYSPAGGWDTNLIWSFGSVHACMVGGAEKNSMGVIYVSTRKHTGDTYVYHNSSGWAQLGGSAIGYETAYSYPKMALDAAGNPSVALDAASGIHVVAWTGASWDDISPATGDANQVVDVEIDSNGKIHIVTRNGTNNYLLYGTRQMDPGLNTGHRSGALLIRANVQNDAADIYIHTDSTIHIESDSLIVEGPISVMDYSLTTAAKITEEINGLSNTFLWSGSITHDSVTAAAVSEDIVLITAFPAKYKILEIFVDVTEKWDDGAGPMSAATLSIGWTGANYDDLIQTQDIYTAATQIGDAAGELNYTSVQSGIRVSWSSNTDLYLRFVATGANLATLTSGELTVYVVYQVF